MHCSTHHCSRSVPRPHFVVHMRTSQRTNADGSYGSGGKPNEDFVVVDDDHHFVILCDGSTRRGSNGTYVNPSPAAMVAQAAANAAAEYLRAQEGTDIPEQVRSAFLAANRAAAKVNCQNGLTASNNEHGLAGAAMIIVRIDPAKGMLHFDYAADPLLMLQEGRHWRLLTPTPLSWVEDYRKTSPDRTAARRYISEQVRNNPDHRGGYGVVNGDERLQSFLKSSAIPVSEGKRIVVASDGLLALLKSNPAFLVNPDPEAIINRQEQLDGLQALRSDDKSLVVIDLLPIPRV